MGEADASIFLPAGTTINTQSSPVPNIQTPSQLITAYTNQNNYKKLLPRNNYKIFDAKPYTNYYQTLGLRGHIFATHLHQTQYYNNTYYFAASIPVSANPRISPTGGGHRRWGDLCTLN